MARMNWEGLRISCLTNTEAYAPRNQQLRYTRGYSKGCRRIYVPSSDEIKSLENKLKTKDVYASIYTKTDGGFHYSIRFNRKVETVRSFPDLLMFVESKVSS